MILEDASKMTPATDEMAWPDMHMIRASRQNINSGHPVFLDVKRQRSIP